VEGRGSRHKTERIYTTHIRRTYVATTSFTFTDMSNAVAGYPASSVKMIIEDKVQKSGNGGTSVNVKEIWASRSRFRTHAT